MNYSQFLGFFVAPCVVAVVIGMIMRARSRLHGEQFPLARAVACLALVSVIAVIYTTPWDSWLIYNAVWWYPPNSIMGTLFGIPYEEYMFMVGLTVLTGCWTLIFAIGRPQPAETTSNTSRLAGASFWLVVIVLGVGLAAASDEWLYMGSMMAWFGAPLAIQSGFGADLLRSNRSLRIAGLALTPLMWIADAVAIDAGTWQLSWVHTVGVRIAGLPVEEAMFFFLVNLLVVNTIILVTHPTMADRIRFMRSVQPGLKPSDADAAYLRGA